MSVALDAVGAVLWITFGCLGLFGAGLIVGVVELALDRNRSASADSMRLRAGRWSQLRRYAIYWVCTAVLWAMAVLALMSLREA